MNERFSKAWVRIGGLVAAVLVAACAPRELVKDADIDPIAQSRALTRAGKPKEALEKFEGLLKDDPDNLAAHRGLVEAAYFAGKLDEVEARYRELVQSAPERGVGYYGLGLVEVARGPGHMEATLAHFAEAEKRMPAEGDLPFRIGLVHTMNGQLAKAEQALRRAIELAPDRATFRVALGGCLVQQGRNQEAIDILRPILQQAPTADDMVKARAITDRMFDPLRGLDPETSQDLQRAMDALDQDAIQEALVLVEKLVLQRPELAFAHLLKGLAHSRMENNGEAIIALERSVELNPHSPTAWAAIGDVYLRTEKWAKARECYERALDLNPLDTQAIERLGEWAITRQDAERAVRAFSSLALLEPSRMEYRLRWAMALVQADRIPEALTVYQGILRLEKHNLVALMRAGSLEVVMAQRDTAAHQAHMDAARRYLEEAHRAAPENKAVQDMLDKLKE